MNLKHLHLLCNILKFSVISKIIILNLIDYANTGQSLLFLILII